MSCKSVLMRRSSHFADGCAGLEGEGVLRALTTLLPPPRASSPWFGDPPFAVATLSPPAWGLRVAACKEPDYVLGTQEDQRLQHADGSLAMRD